MRKDTDQDGHDYRELYRRLALQSQFLSQVDKPEGKRRLTTRAKPSNENRGGRAEAVTDQRYSYRRHPDDCQAQDGAQLERGTKLTPVPHDDHAEEHEHRKGDQFSPLTAEFQTLLGDTLESELDRKTGNECGNEHARIEHLANH